MEKKKNKIILELRLKQKITKSAFYLSLHFNYNSHTKNLTTKNSVNSVPLW